MVQEGSVSKETLLEMQNAKNFAVIGESIIINSNKEEEINSVLRVAELESLDAFLLGVAVILFGVETHIGNCNKILDKAISVTTIIPDFNKYRN